MRIRIRAAVSTYDNSEVSILSRRTKVAKGTWRVGISCLCRLVAWPEALRLEHLGGLLGRGWQITHVLLETDITRQLASSVSRIQGSSPTFPTSSNEASSVILVVVVHFSKQSKKTPFMVCSSTVVDPKLPPVCAHLIAL